MFRGLARRRIRTSLPRITTYIPVLVILPLVITLAFMILALMIPTVLIVSNNRPIIHTTTRRRVLSVVGPRGPIRTTKRVVER